MKEHDIIQITDESDPWFPALLIVSGVASYGVQAYCLIPRSNNEGPAQQAYRRLLTGKFVVVGSSVVVAK